MAWHRAAARRDVLPGTLLEVEIGGHALALYDLEGVVYATQAVCPHQAAWFSQGTVEGDRVHCPRHQGCFHIPTGKQISGPACPSLKVYPTRIEAGTVLIAGLDQSVVRPE
ncbi:MAG TPA: non-heme iron oxygenase ferredoxin subunit [Stellaceae bacterium]|nr:non-heme iron oxygenase ferredoxin subunit [Stellaceae bacterium]